MSQKKFLQAVNIVDKSITGCNFSLLTSLSCGSPVALVVQQSPFGKGRGECARMREMPPMYHSQSCC